MKNAVIHNIRAKVSSKGQVVLSRVLRGFLGVRPGSEIVFEARQNGSCQIKPMRRSIQMLFGRLKRSGAKPLTVEAMDAAIIKAVSE